HVPAPLPKGEVCWVLISVLSCAPAFRAFSSAMATAFSAGSKPVTSLLREPDVVPCPIPTSKARVACFGNFHQEGVRFEVEDFLLRRQEFVPKVGFVARLPRIHQLDLGVDFGVREAS